MRIKYFYLLVFSIMNCSAQFNNESKFIKSRCFEGYIFSKEYIGLIPLENIKEKYTPTNEEILEAERILKEQIPGLNKDLINQLDNCPIIHKKLKKYKRQYVGYINNEGEKIIWINFFWTKEENFLANWGKEIIIILDGCSYYWNVKVNLNKNKLFELSVNGSG